MLLCHPHPSKSTPQILTQAFCLPRQEESAAEQQLCEAALQHSFELNANMGMLSCSQ